MQKWKLYLEAVCLCATLKIQQDLKLYLESVKAILTFITFIAFKRRVAHTDTRVIALSYVAADSVAQALFTALACWEPKVVLFTGLALQAGCLSIHINITLGRHIVKTGALSCCVVTDTSIWALDKKRLAVLIVGQTPLTALTWYLGTNISIQIESSSTLTPP